MEGKSGRREDVCLRMGKEEEEGMGGRGVGWERNWEHRVLSK